MRRLSAERVTLAAPGDGLERCSDSAILEFPHLNLGDINNVAVDVGTKTRGNPPLLFDCIDDRVVVLVYALSVLSNIIRACAAADALFAEFLPKG